MLFWLCFYVCSFGIVWIGISHVFDFSRLAYIYPSPWANGQRFASIPFGLFLLFAPGWNYIDMESMSAVIYDSLLYGLAIAGLLWNFFPPRFLYPLWYKWIIKHHGDIWPLLREEAAKDYRSWYAETRTIKELEVWVKSVREKYGLG